MKNTGSINHLPVHDLGRAFAHCAAEFKSQLATMQSELAQVQGLFLDAVGNLAGSFTRINSRAQSQQQLALGLIEKMEQLSANLALVRAAVQVTANSSDEIAARDVKFALQCGPHGGELKLQEAHRVDAELAAGELACVTLQLGQDVNAAVTMLQFQDIATQLLGHVRRRADVLTGVADKIGALAGALAAEGVPAVDDETRTQGLRRVCDELAALLASVHQATTMNPARQTSMATGEVEMF